MLATVPTFPMGGLILYCFRTLSTEGQVHWPLEQHHIIPTCFYYYCKFHSLQAPPRSLIPLHSVQSEQ